MMNRKKQSVAHTLFLKVIKTSRRVEKIIEKAI